ncbi:hypothetical protein KFU94_10755 [Chloroflexi bacterium TSY]|nr:hypothetical protein [Chloroflexi bacterium TSY]
MTRKNKKNSQSNKKRETPLSARERRENVRRKAARQRTNQNRLLIGAAVFMVMLIGGFVYLGTRAQAGVNGELTYESQ